MTFQTQLRIPGPTPLPERVVRSMNRPMIDHRGPEFAAILARDHRGRQARLQDLERPAAAHVARAPAASSRRSPTSSRPATRWWSLCVATSASGSPPWRPPTAPTSCASSSSGASRSNLTTCSASSSSSPGGRGRAAHAQRDLDRAHQPAARAGARGARRRPDRGRGRRELDQLDRNRDRRVGHRRRGQRLAEGLDGASGIRPRQRQRARVGAAGEGALAPFLLRLEGGKGLG